MCRENEPHADVVKIAGPLPAYHLIALRDRETGRDEVAPWKQYHSPRASRLRLARPTWKNSCNPITLGVRRPSPRRREGQAAAPRGEKEECSPADPDGLLPSIASTLGPAGVRPSREVRGEQRAGRRWACWSSCCPTAISAWGFGRVKALRGGVTLADGGHRPRRQTPFDHQKSRARGRHASIHGPSCREIRRA
jgi:hypothetical protein